jgi:hypothetical protein
MLGAIAVAALSAWLTLREARWYLGPITNWPPVSIAGFRQADRAWMGARVSLWRAKSACSDCWQTISPRQENTMNNLPTADQGWLNKVPEVTLSFWIIKIMSTTVGETGADFLAVNAGLGQGVTRTVMARCWQPPCSCSCVPVATPLGFTG